MSYATLDAIIEQWRPVIEAVQAAQLEINGAYTQGLWSHATPPEIGFATAPDNLDAKPTDVAVSSAEMTPANLPDEWRLAVCWDVYQGPQGHGYINRFAVIDNGVRMEIAIDEGGSGWSHGWQPVTP